MLKFNIIVIIFFQIETHAMMSYTWNVVFCYGITKDLKTNNLMIVMNYTTDGNLRHYLNNSFNSMEWSEKLKTLKDIMNSLKDIHDN